MKRTFLLMFTSVLLAFMLSGCFLDRFSPEYKVTDVTQAVNSADDLTAMDAYPNLETADLRGSDNYDDIIEYIETHPQVTVIYDVALGGQRWPLETEEMTLIDGTFTVDELLTNSQYLPNLKSVFLPTTTLDAESIQLLRKGLENVFLNYTVNVMGVETSIETEFLDLSALLPEQLDETIVALQNLPLLSHIQLVNAEGTSALGVADVKKLMEALPETIIDYSFELFGQTITTADERVEFINIPIGNEGVDQVRQALDILPYCTYLLMDTCGVDDEIMAQMRDDYAGRTKVVWRVWLVEEDYSSRLFLRTGSYLTDTHRVRTTYVNDENSHLLNYCTETKYVDVGHVWQLTQCEFLAYMPDLEVCIIAITEITDITPLANHDKLEYLELFTTDISDISPLLTCPNIEHLNLSNMPKLDDITPVYSLKNLKRLRMVDSPLISSAEKQKAAEELPDCTMLNMGNFATAWGWRYLDPQKQNPDPRYALLCEQMEYSIDAKEYGIP